MRRLDQSLGDLTLYAGQADIEADSDFKSIAHGAEIYFGVDRCVGRQRDLLPTRDDLHRTEEGGRPAGGEQLLRIGSVPYGLTLAATTGLLLATAAVAGPLRIRGTVVAISSTFSRRFRRVAAGLAASLALGALSAHAAPTPFPADFRSSQVVNVDATINVRVDGHGPAVVLTHGFGETGDMWSPMAAELAKDHTVVVPDLRGMGLSSHPAGGYDKWTQAGDIRAVLDKLGIDRADIVGHDIGTMVAYAYAARYPDKTSRLVVIDSPVPGIPPWKQIVRLPALWHFNFGGPDAERLVAGRERIYLDRFWNEFAGDPSKIDEATRRHYAAIYARPGAMQSAFAQFLAIGQKDEADNLKAMETKLAMPVLAIGAAKAFGANVAVGMRNAATNAQEVVVPSAGHWLMEEAPAATIAAVRDFIAAY